MELIFLTGISGAGKSQAAAYLEDQGYFCVDNLPPVFLPDIVKMFSEGEGDASGIGKLAIVVDVRSRSLLRGWGKALQVIENELGIPFSVIFLEASDEVLVSRYRQTRRNHPLNDEMSLLDAIAAERKLLQNIRGRATYIVDTTMLTNAGLKREIRNILKQDANAGISVFIESFGFMYGTPADCENIIDVRFLQNPFWVEELRLMSGLDEPIQKYLQGFEETSQFMEKISDVFDFMLPQFLREGKSRVTIGVGCTGGRHRSVYIAEALGKAIEEKGYRTIVSHRDIDRDPRYAVKENKE
ncbi:MAG: RNase adapter RapZ [Saccharofermentans sp.]|nr:RNase adapter RapZ [Saccharofermentans sp.]